jgi:hypothetical protein
MGEIVIAPIYEVLARRGVRFAFFHRVDEVIPADGRIASIRVTVGDRPGWTPLVDVGGVACWRPDEVPEDGRATELVVGRDFDRVILGIPIGALPAVAGRLAGHPRWAAAFAHASTCATLSAQIWMDVPGSALGGASIRGELPLYGGRVGDVDTWADLSHLGAAEGWTQESRMSVHYLCGPWAADPSEFAPRLEAFLAGPSRDLWPGAHGSEGFRWEWLHDPESRRGPDRLAAQVVRVNAEASERYVLTLPGSTRHRIPADDTGFSNLTVAGDWTANGMNLGCIEATVMSGLLASRAVCGLPARVPWSG